MGIKVLLVDHHCVVREGVKALVRNTDDIDVVGEASDGREAVEKAAESSPDVVIIGLRLPQMSGVVATRRILSNTPNTSVLVLSISRDKSCVIAALKAGAKGYLAKDCTPTEIIEAIRAVAAGRSYFCAQIKDLLLNDYTNRVSAEDSTVSLSDREQLVLQQIAIGKSTKETAFTLGVSVKTIETHRRRIMHKLGAHSTADLVRYAVREGFVSTW